MYVPSKPFTCLDGSATIPFEFVNDDYCDCQGKVLHQQCRIFSCFQMERMNQEHLRAQLDDSSVKIKVTLEH